MSRLFVARSGQQCADLSEPDEDEEEGAAGEGDAGGEDPGGAAQPRPRLPLLRRPHADRLPQEAPGRVQGRPVHHHLI